MYSKLFTKLSTKLLIAPVGTLILSGITEVNPAFAKNILLKDNFDTENYGQAETDYSNLKNWNVTDGSVDLIGNGTFDFRPGNGLYLDLDGSQYNAGKLESKGEYKFNAGEIIELSFDFLGRNDFDDSYLKNDEVIVSLGSLFKETFSADALNLTSKGPTVSIKRNIKVESPTFAKLVFDHKGGDFGGLLLDNVELSVIPKDVQKSVPEPASMLGLLAVGLAGSVSTFKRKKQ
ncbi:MAG: PEP-CTERM sorting domain-containing protein [Cyanobacteria bacterium P01_A01_bin.84]